MPREQVYFPYRDLGHVGVFTSKSIAHHKITSKLGKGGMGEVYRVRDTRLNREVASMTMIPADKLRG